MLITYPTPILKPDSGITVDATVVTGLAGMKDGRAGALTLLAWPEGDTVTIQASFPAGTSMEPRVAALVNLEGLPTGLDVTVSLKLVDGAYDYQTQVVQTHLTRSGETGVLAFWPAGLDQCEGVQFVIDGTGVMLENDEFGVGELVLSAAGALGMDATWGAGIEQILGETVSRSGQLYHQPVPAARALDVSIPPSLFTQVFTDPNAYDHLRMALANDPRCVVVPDWSTQARAESTWIYGIARRLDDIRFSSRSRRGTARMRFVEMVGRAV